MLTHFQFHFRPALASFASLFLLGGLVLGCSSTDEVPAGQPPNLVLVTLDTTRADHLGTYGYFRNTSPSFDEFAAEAVVFERLIVPMATTLPSHLSILTSSHPLEHGVLANTTQGGARFVPAPGLTSLAVAAQAAGYATGAFVSAAPLKAGSGIEVGFDTFNQPEDKNRLGERTTLAALEWLETLDSDQPYFLWVHFYDAHFPFEAPEPYAGTFGSDAELESFISERRIHRSAARPLVGVVDDARQVANAYDDELLYQDAQFAAVLGAVREHAGEEGWARTAVVVTGDHGEGLCQHGEAAHGSTWDEQLNAPLVIRVPGQEPRREGVVLTSSDIFPTTLSMLGSRASVDISAFAKYRESALGHDVLAEAFEGAPVLSQDTGRTRGVPFKYALTYGGFKYFRIENDDGSVDERLFDLGVDPHELRDASGSLEEMLEEMRGRTNTAIAERLARGATLRGDASAVADEADPGLLTELCALGYIEPERCAAHAAETAQPD
jgi:arylsulfatase A-like enzyme